MRKHVAALAAGARAHESVATDAPASSARIERDFSISIDSPWIPSSPRYCGARRQALRANRPARAGQAEKDGFLSQKRNFSAQSQQIAGFASCSGRNDYLIGALLKLAPTLDIRPRSVCLQAPPRGLACAPRFAEIGAQRTPADI